MAQEIRKYTAKSKTPDMPVIDMMPEPVSEVTIRDVLNMVRRRRKLMASVFSLGIIGTVVFLVLVTPKYQAVGQLLMDNRASQVKNINSVIATPQSELSDVPNEVQLLMSRVLAGVVVDKLDLADDPEFNPAMQPSADAARGGEGASGAKGGTPAVASVPAGNAAADNAPADKAADIGDPSSAMMVASRAKILDAFLKRLEVSAERRSRVVEVAFESADSEKAARIVNTLMQSYLTNQVQYQKKTLAKATERLNKIVADLKLEVTDAEVAMQRFRESTRLIDGKGGTSIAGQQLA